MNFLRRFFLLGFVLFACSPIMVSAQNQHVIDSIREKLKTQPNDTSRARLLSGLSWEISYSNLFEGLVIGQQALDLSMQLKAPRQESDARNVLGTIYQDLGDYAKALDMHLRAIHIRDSLKDYCGLCVSYINISDVYHSQGKTAEALRSQITAVELAKKYTCGRGECVSYNNIGESYLQLDSVSKALDYFRQGLSCSMMRKTDYVPQVHSLCGMAKCFAAMNDQTNADWHLAQAMQITRQKLGQYDRIFSYSSLGDVRRRQKRYDDAVSALDSAMRITRLLNATDLQRGLLEKLAALYEEKGDKDNALGTYKLYNKLRDSLLSESNIRRMSELDAFYQNTKKDNEIAVLKRDNQWFLIVSISGGIALLLLIALAFMLYNRIKIRQRTSEQLNRQKMMIEEKNKEITDSINYAQKIQLALMPRPDDFADTLQQGFVVFAPKDIVSGDFFWLGKQGPYAFWATADCTGHGVPGGFMSMLGSTFLNEIVNERHETEPAAILNQLRERVISALRQTGSASESKDGMDMVICRVNYETNELVYAAANNSLYIINSDGEFNEYKADKMPVGYHPEQKSFSQHTIQLRANDMIYTFTDGYADQFGGPQGKKFKYRRFQELLRSIAAKRTDEQDKILEKTFNEWRGNNEQTDDMLIIGIRILR